MITSHRSSASFTDCQSASEYDTKSPCSYSRRSMDCRHHILQTTVTLTCTIRRCALQSADVMTLVTSRTKTTAGDRTFAAAGATVWNSLPCSTSENHRSLSLSLRTFARLLKSHLFDATAETSIKCVGGARRNASLLNSKTLSIFLSQKFEDAFDIALQHYTSCQNNAFQGTWQSVGNPSIGGRSCFHKN